PRTAGRRASSHASAATGGRRATCRRRWGCTFAESRGRSLKSTPTSSSSAIPSSKRHTSVCCQRPDRTALTRLRAYTHVHHASIDVARGHQLRHGGHPHTPVARDGVEERLTPAALSQRPHPD